MPAIDPALDDVAAAIVDGTPIDWSVAESGTTEEFRALLEELRVLSTLANVHRDPGAVDLVIPRPSRVDRPAQWGRLRLIERIGGGTFGDVYRAWDPRLHREVAVKLIPTDGPGSSSADDIIREGRLLARVHHSGVVAIYDAEQIGAEVGLCMEFVEGQTLQQRVEQQGQVSVDETLDIGLQLCEALSAVHDAGVLHRDIKASNVVIRANGRVALMDFGAGKHFDDGVAAAVTGTPLYVAPEVLRGAPPTVSADVYSLAVLLHYMLTGSYPISATSLAGLCAAHDRRMQELTAGTEPARAASPGNLGDVIERALDARPDRRYGTVAELAKNLRRLQAPKRAVYSAAAGWIAALLVLAVAAGAVLTERFSRREPVRIAILPFAMTGTDPDDDSVREEMARDLIARMEKHQDLYVISTASILSPTALKLPLRQLGARLGVSVMLTGRLRRSGENIEAHAQLIRASDERTLWSRQYARPASDTLDLYRALAADLGRELRLKSIATPERLQIPRSDAHTAYMRGQAALDRSVGRDSQVTAKELFEKAIALDQSYAPPHAGLARVYLHMNPQFVGEDALRRASDAAARAMSLDPSLADAYVAAAIVKSAKADWAGAERDFRRSVTLGPNSVLARQEFAMWLSLHARFDEALEHARMAASLDPLSARAILALSSALRFARQYDEAMSQSLKALEIDPASASAHLNLGHCYQGLGRLAEAIEAFQRVPQPGGNLGNAYALAGRTREARALVALFEERFARTGVGAGEVAQIYVGLGEIDRAFAWLDRQSHTWPTTLKVAAVWDPLRSDPRFKALLERRGLSD